MLAYDQWLERRIASRSGDYARPNRPVSFSLLTPVYEKSDAGFLAEAARSVLNQSYRDYEWILLAQGPISSDLEHTLAKIASHPHCRVLRHERNLGIIGGLRQCLEAATADYVIPVDADDLLTSDALHIVADVAGHQRRPALIYSDEDRLVGGIPSAPYLRPDWDPVLALSTSYIWHLIAIDRTVALQLSAYTDAAANWCHDWDTVLRTAAAGKRIVHVPEVLYHWREHAASSTNRPEPEPASLHSQRHVLERWVATHPGSELFKVERFPADRGAPGYWIARRPVAPPSLALLGYGTDADLLLLSVSSALESAAGAVREIHLVGIADLTASGRDRIVNLTGSSSMRIVVWPRARPYDLVLALANSSVSAIAVLSENATVKPGWLWEADRLLRLHPEVAMVAARILDTSGVVLSGGEVFGLGGIYGSPGAGRSDSDPGPYGITLQARCVSAPHPWFFVARRPNFVEGLRSLPIETTWAMLGAWLGGTCSETGQLVAFSPSMNAVSQSSAAIRPCFSPEESAAFAHRFVRFIPDLRRYSRWYAWMPGEPYTVRTAGT